MIKINPESISDLVALKEAGIPVTLTSHPGNASLYKLVLWSCGIPEHFWDVTCCKADANNWPMHRLINGIAELLISEDLHKRILKETNPNKRFVVAYQLAANGDRLGRIHIKACEASFPRGLSSCSRLLLSEADRVREMFEYLAETRKDMVFGRFITPDGIMKPIGESGIKTQDLAGSFMQVLRELDHLLFRDEPIVTMGGACYDGVMVPLSTMLAQYWQTGRMDRYDISGPDMINYATKPEHQAKLSEMLKHLRRWNPRLVPDNILIHMFPGTVVRVGYIKDHCSEGVMKRKMFMLQNAGSLSGERKRIIWGEARDDESLWPAQIKPSVDKYFSQHDLLNLERRLIVDEFWRAMPILSIREALVRANNLLRI